MTSAIGRQKLWAAKWENVQRLARWLGIPAECSCWRCRTATIEAVARRTG